MGTWQEEYIQALQYHARRTDLHNELIDAYTQLADRTATLEAEKFASSDSPPSGTDGSGPRYTYPSEVPNQTKSDFAEALRAKSQLQIRLKSAQEEIEKLRARSFIDIEAIRNLSSERTLLITKVKDRDEELKGKAKLVEEVQDEMVSLNLQLNMAEQRSNKLLNENKDLIDRWMARKGEEADAINNASKFS